MRGIVILDMVLVHFDYVFPTLLAKVIDYSDFAMEGFIFLAGYSVAMRYWPIILERPGTAFRKLIAKALKLYAVQALMIFTISLPLYLLVFEQRRAQESIGAFTLKSLALLNQVGLIHILPTFIPLFVISPLLLFAFKRGLDSLVLAASVFLFTLGNVHPYLLDLGEKTIFPFILWQIYFVAGCYLGIRKGRHGPSGRERRAQPAGGRPVVRGHDAGETLESAPPRVHFKISPERAGVALRSQYLMAGGCSSARAESASVTPAII